MGTFGRADWLVNGVLFACYHLHEPWVIPQTLLVDTFAEALPSRRWRSSLIGIAVHSSQRAFSFVIGLALANTRPTPSGQHPRNSIPAEPAGVEFREPYSN